MKKYIVVAGNIGVGKSTWSNCYASDWDGNPI